MCYRLLAPGEACKQQNGEEEVVLGSHKHPMRSVGQRFQHFYTPRYEREGVNVRIYSCLAVMIELIGCCMMCIVLGLPPVSTKPLRQQ